MSNLRYAAMSVILFLACGNEVRAQTVSGSSVAVEDGHERLLSAPKPASST
jgi:hypothetical protein